MVQVHGLTPTHHRPGGGWATDQPPAGRWHQNRRLTTATRLPDLGWYPSTSRPSRRAPRGYTQAVTSCGCLKFEQTGG